MSAAPEEPSFEEVGHELADLVRVANRIKAEQKWDKEHTYVIDIIRILQGQIGIRKMDLDAALREKRVADQEPIPKAFDKTVQSVLNQHTSQSKVFRKKNKRANDDLFYSPKGKHSGTWALRSDERARNWVKRKIGEVLRCARAVVSYDWPFGGSYIAAMFMICSKSRCRCLRPLPATLDDR